MAKFCPQCNHIKTSLTNLSQLNNCTPPLPNEKFCVKCGTELESEKEVVVICPECSEIRRSKPFQFNTFTGIGLNTELTFNPSLDKSPTVDYVQFCGGCGFDFEKSS